MQTGKDGFEMFFGSYFLLLLVNWFVCM